MNARTGRLRNTTPAIILLLISLTLVGCGGGDGPPVSSVSGQVKLDNVPLIGASIIFKADGYPAAASYTDTSGNYELRYLGRDLGAVIGENYVTISPAVPDDATEETPDLYLPIYEGKRTVSSSGPNVFDFDLKSGE